MLPKEDGHGRPEVVDKNLVTCLQDEELVPHYDGLLTKSDNVTNQCICRSNRGTYATYENDISIHQDKQQLSSISKPQSTLFLKR